MIGKRFRSLPFIFANDNYTLSQWGICLNCYMLKFLYVSFRTDMTGYDTGNPGEEQGKR